MPKPDFKTRNLKYLLGIAGKVADGGPTNEYGAHTLVKLIALASYSYQFCNIVNGEKTRARGYDGSVYVDLFAGPGLVKIAGKPDLVAGSPIAADSGGRFDLAVLVEKQKKKAEALRQRMGTLLPTEKFEVIEGDCNEKIEEVAALISKRFSKPIILAFVDPEGLDVNIKTLDVLSKHFPSVDFIVNVTEGMGRVQSTIKDGETKNKPKFERFVGDALSSLFLNDIDPARQSEAYKELVLPTLGRPLSSTIPVYFRGDHLLYTLIFCTRESETGSPWIKIWDYIAKQLRGCEEVTKENLLDAVTGRTETLDSWSSAQATSDP